MYIRKIEISLILLVCLITSSIMIFFIKEACNTQVQASSLFMGDGQTKVVMITLDYMELQDIMEDDYLQSLFNKGYMGLLSSRQIGKSSASKVKLSIGAGKRLMLNNNMINAISFQDQSEGFYQPIFDGNPENVIYTNITDLKYLNKSSEYARYVGYLGDKLNDMGKLACVIGNSDTEVNNRNNVLMAMDSQGIVDYGEVEDVVLNDLSFPGGKRTDFSKLAEMYNRYYAVSDLLIVDTGDLARLEHYKGKMEAAEYKIFRKQTISRISEFIRGILALDKSNTTYIFLSAYPPSESVRMGYKLTPFITYTNESGGLLFSHSTRRDGIITSLDLADYIIEKLKGAGKSQLIEKVVKDPLEVMLQLKKRLLSVSQMRLPVLTWYAVLEIVCAVFGLLYMLNMKIIKSEKLKALVKTTLLVNIVAPIVLLYMSVFYIKRASVFLLVFVLASYAVVYIISRAVKDTIDRFTIAALLVNISLTIDLIRNSTLIKGSVFGYDPIIGARFYGIGNEFAGVYLGSSILLAGCLLQRFKNEVNTKPILTNIILLIYFTAQLYTISMPSMGANFGATIAAVCGIYFFFNSVKRKRLDIKRIILLGVVVVAAISTVIFIDLMGERDTTHIGKFIIDIKENGVRVLMSTFSRKLEMNIRLMKYTIWTKVLLCIILIITIMFFKPVRLLHRIFKKYPYLSSAWLGISAGSITGLIVNDSGIVMAATAMIFTGYTILYMCLEEMETEQSGG